MSDHPLLSYQPLRLLFQAYYVAKIASQVPYYTARAIVPYFRPHPEWTAKQSFMSCLVYRLLDLTSRIGITETLTLRTGKEGQRFQVIRPASADVYLGLLASSTVQPAVIGGTWYPRVPDADLRGKRVFLYFHGGAFIQGDGRDETCGPIAAKLIEKGGADAVFSVQYRLSGYGGLNPFPAALQDAVTSYLYLLKTLHVPATQVVLAGDSSGGNLAVALLRYLHHFGSTINVSPPKCAVLISPWVEPFYYNTGDNPHRKTDFVPSTYGHWGANAYAGRWPNARSDPYVTPLGKPFPTPVPIFASAGTAELFYERILEWSEQMRQFTTVEVYEEKHAVHDTFLSGGILGFEESAWRVAENAGVFVRKQFSLEH
ncbi:alpha/beta hydrolase fold-3 domain-containing protein [Xylariaceae sp. FL1272]|nr:alpha/beta hydrolase fold-3 domain-containing protein [Xylariaceae sp. FL1272]